MTMRDRPTRTAVVFTILALGFSLLYWLAVVLSKSGALPFSMEHADFARKSLPGTIIWLLFDNFGPTLAAIIAVASCRGRSALADLGRSIVRWRVPGRLYVLAWFGLLINTGVVIAGYATHTLRFDPSAFTVVKFVLLYFVMIAFDGPLGEEIGWRGVLLPNLMERVRPLPAALIVGVIWYAWHVPLYAAEGRMSTAFDHAFFLYTCIALSIVFTWFFVKSNGSTFLMIYLHNASNYSTFLRFKLFPKVADSHATAYAYGAVLLAITAAAAVALRGTKANSPH
jgi:membrane protease YdiL (CAAX protease family)